jgi:hypothetical protein
MTSFISTLVLLPEEFTVGDVQYPYLSLLGFAS